VRLFVAVDPGAGDPAAPEHLTLAFLGEVPEGRRAEIEAALRAVAARAAPFAATLDRIGAFPSAERPRVVYRGVGAGAAALEALAASVRTALEPFAPSVGRDRFVPHVTLLRVRSAADQRTARALLEGRRPAPPARSFLVGELRLKASELGRDGARHRTLAAFPLGPTPSDPAGRASFARPVRDATY